MGEKMYILGVTLTPYPRRTRNERQIFCFLLRGMHARAIEVFSFRLRAPPLPRTSPTWAMTVACRRLLPPNSLLPILLHFFVVCSLI